MRLATYNIHGWRTADGAPNWHGVADLLQSMDADIIGLNEVFHPRTVAGVTAPALPALADSLGMYYHFGPCLRWPAQDDMPENAYGNALLSRWPIIAGAAHHLTPKEENLQAAVAGKEERGLLEGRILLPSGQTFTVYVTHLDHTDEQARLAQLRTLRTWTSRDRNRPHVVMGDFNAISRWDWDEDGLEFLRRQPENRGGNLANGNGPQTVVQMEKAGYTDLFAQFGQPGQATFLGTEDKNLRIDYIFASAALAPQATGCVVWQAAGDEPSDHRPVVADFAMAVA
jgi:endonuclease/exonuclease/phosphatase family metal-dependent hydrolase